MDAVRGLQMQYLAVERLGGARRSSKRSDAYRLRPQLRRGVLLLVLMVVVGCTSGAGTDRASEVANDVTGTSDGRSLSGQPSSELAQALVRLEQSMDRVGHVLADPAMRPAGRDEAELRGAAKDLLDVPLPADLVTLWGWWGNILLPPETREIRPTVLGLPGRVSVMGLESAVRTRDDLAMSWPDRAVRNDWLPIAFQTGDLIMWIQLDACATGGVGLVTVGPIDHHPGAEPPWQFTSLAKLVDAMAYLLDEEILVYDSLLGWHQDGPHEWPPWNALGRDWDDDGPSPSDCDGRQNPSEDVSDTSSLAG